MDLLSKMKPRNLDFEKIPSRESKYPYISRQIKNQKFFDHDLSTNSNPKKNQRATLCRDNTVGVLQPPGLRS